MTNRSQTPTRPAPNLLSRAATLSAGARARVKTLLWQLLPNSVLIWAMGKLHGNKREDRPIEEVFTEIYESGSWGSADGGYYSGSGSHAEEMVQPYVDAMRQWLASIGGNDLTLVDLGCGDYAIGRLLAPYVSSYVGVDVVAPVIAENQRRYGSESVRFEHRDIVADDLPPGDVCVIRQVLQHLSNDHISRILEKLSQYRWAVITEHRIEPMAAPNLDKPHGSSTRMYLRSGVVLDAPPFDIPKERLQVLLRTPVWEQVGPFRQNRGVLETIVYTTASQSAETRTSNTPEAPNP